MRRLSWLRKRGSRLGFALCWCTLPLLLFVLVLSGGIYSYHRLTNEALVAELSFSPVGPQRYIATLTDADGCRSRDYLVLGDQWRVDAEFIKWHYWATLLGLDPLYRLERLEGRYQDTGQQNTQPHLAHDLRDAGSLDLLQLVQSLGSLNLLFDTSYGSSSYMTIDPDQHYRLFRSQTGLLVRVQTAPDLALVNDHEGVTITISHACADQQSLWQRWAEQVDGWLVGSGGS